MAKNKTTETGNSVTDYLNSIADEARRNDCFALAQIMESTTGYQPKMWGTGIVGFGSYHYTYASGHQGDAPLVAFASRAAAITLYLLCNVQQTDSLLQQLGKHKAGKGCVYIKRLSDVDVNVLKQLIQQCVQYLQQTYKQ